MRAVVWVLLMASLGVLGGCQGDANRANRANSPNGSNSANPKNQTPSCLPPGYRPCGRGSPGTPARAEVRGEELDVKLAVVEGEVITRRRLVREAGPRAPGQSEAAYENALHNRLKQRARLLLFVREAFRAGVQVSAQRLDEVVAENLAERVREAEETTGQQVTATEYLAEKNLTYNEFRSRVREELLYKAYMWRLLEGLGSEGRPQVDMTVSPAEVRRVYWSHPGAFDEKPGVRFVVWQIPVERYLSDDVGFLDAEEMASADAERMAEAFKRGAEPAEIARRFELGEGEWKDSGTFVEREGLERLIGEEPTTWLFDPARHLGEVTVFQEAMGPIVLGIQERRPAKRIPYDEAYPKIVQMYSFVRQRRLEEQRLIEILSTRNVIHPPELHDELLMDAEMTLAEMNRDPVLGAARFR